MTDFTATLPRKRMGAGMLFTDDASRVLLVEPIYKRVWEVPGGAVEADESPRAATVRELAEELGLAVTPGRLLVVDWVPPRDGRTEGLMLVFDGGVLTPAETDAIRLPADELRSWAWCDPQQAQQRLSDCSPGAWPQRSQPAPRVPQLIWRTAAADTSVTEEEALWTMS